MLRLTFSALIVRYLGEYATLGLHIGRLLPLSNNSGPREGGVTGIWAGSVMCNHPHHPPNFLGKDS